MAIYLLGIFLAAMLFGAVLYAGYQAFLSAGWPRWLHSGTIALTLLVMLSITYAWPLMGQGTGGMLALSALGAVIVTRGWSRFLPLTLGVFGVFAAMGIPFV